MQPRLCRLFRIFQTVQDLNQLLNQSVNCKSEVAMYKFRSNQTSYDRLWRVIHTYQSRFVQTTESGKNFCCQRFVTSSCSKLVNCLLKSEPTVYKFINSTTQLYVKQSWHGENRIWIFKWFFIAKDSKSKNVNEGNKWESGACHD